MTATAPAPGTAADDGPVAAPLARFARAHLRTRAQRAVYQAAGSNPESWWRTGEIATHTALDQADIDQAEIDQALRSFAAAGILHERIHPSGGRVHRWHDELRYRFQGTSPRPTSSTRSVACPWTGQSSHRP